MTGYFFEASIFAIEHGLAIGLIGVLSYVLGRRLTRRFVYHSFPEQLSFSLTLGLGALAYVLLLLGALNLIYGWLVMLVLAAGVAWCYPVWAAWPGAAAGLYARFTNAPWRKRWLLVCLGLAVLALLLPFYLMPLYPPVADDAIMYHLPYAKLYKQNHGLIFTPYLRFAVAPQTNELLFLLALLLHDDITAHLIEFLMLLTLGAISVAFGRRFFSARAGWWAGTILLSNPILLWLGAHAYVDMGMALFCTAAIFAFGIWLDGRERRWLVLAGLFCGLAVGTKLSALIVPALLGTVLLYLAARERKLVSVIIFGATALLVASPWLARSFYYTGNPLYPFFQDSLGKWLGGGRLTPALEQQLWSVITNDPHYWNGRDLRSLLLLPWDLTFNRRKFYSQVPLSPIYLLMFPLLLVVVIVKERVRKLLAMAGAYILYWFLTIRDLRYFAPALPLLSVAAAATLDEFTKVLSRWWKWPSYRPSYKLVTTVGFVALISYGWLYAAYSFYNRDRLPVSQEERDAFLTRQLPAYPAYQFLNRLRGADYTVYALFNHKMTYYADGRFISALFAPGGYASIFDGDYRNGKLVEGEALYRKLKGLGADYLLVETDAVQVKLPPDNFFKTRFRLIYEQPHLQLFELTAADGRTN